MRDRRDAGGGRRAKYGRTLLLIHAREHQKKKKPHQKKGLGERGTCKEIGRRGSSRDSLIQGANLKKREEKQEKEFSAGKTERGIKCGVSEYVSL